MTPVISSLESNVWLVALAGQLLIVAWLAFVCQAILRNAAKAVLWAVPLGVVLGFAWRLTDPAQRSFEALGLASCLPPTNVDALPALVFLLFSMVGAAISGALLAGLVARTERRAVQLWAGIAATVIVVGLLAGWTFRPRTVFSAIRYHDLAAVQRLIEDSPDLVNERDRWGDTPCILQPI